MTPNNCEIVPLSPEIREEWNAFCLGSGSAWFRHTTFFLEYSLNCRFDRKSRNVSFCLRQNNEIVAAVPLLVQTVYSNPGEYEFAIGDTNTPFPAFSSGLYQDNRTKLVKIIFGEIDRLAGENKVAYSRMFIDPLTEDILNSAQKANLIAKHGYNETSLSTNILPLGGTEQELFSGIRKGHKHDIKTAARDNLAVEIYAQDAPEDVFGVFRELHLLDAGRKTRPDESWDIMRGFLRDGYAVLALAKDTASGRYAAGAYIMTYKKNAYYGSAATHPESAGRQGLGHLIQWEIIRYLKSRGFGYYEIGWNFSRTLSQEIVSEKELNISHFKTGFGGDLYPLFRGEKFYSKDYFNLVHGERAERFIGTIRPGGSDE